MMVKEFLRATWGKLLLFIIISILFIPFLKYHVRCQIPPCWTISKTLFTSLINSMNFEGINYFNLIIGLIISYLVSSAFIIWFNKLKKKIESKK